MDINLLQLINEVIGAVLRTRDKVKPLYVSIGRKIDLRKAVFWVLERCRAKSIRLAHLVVAGRLESRQEVIYS